ncbi:GGDEF domain-containing protein [Mycolicibacterium sp. 120266]|uniref:GGDEF domain-containing protein n=1 Tax=Mycolicibacterium sp. 120266 TaxID=3090601 RepID=UPI00299D2F87|nr:GGDEF domain-containing protein [Mycolicibacterium sp. 120266]MDX1875953.1 GGDEF domain-containing protein [Mycolicibacterium sp. 120266]
MLLDAKARRAVGRALVQWWTTPVDYDGQVGYFAKRSLAGLIRVLIGAAATVIGCVVLVAQLSAVAPAPPYARAAALAFAVCTFAGALAWWLAPWPSRLLSRACIVGFDVGILLVSLLDTRALSGSFALSALTLVSFYIVFFDGPKVIVLHSLWCVVTMVAVAVRIGAELHGDIALVLARALAGIALAFAPAAVQFAIWVLRTDANEAATDPLTGLLNRRGLSMHIDGLVRRRLKGERTVLVAVLDLDRFKGINDAYGHAAGDEVLVRSARRLEAVVSGSALVARVGGEEFVVVDIVAPGEAEPTAEKLRAALADHTDPAVTASVGATGLSAARFAAGDDPVGVLGHLIARADDAMFAAKRDGGDKVVFAAHPPTAGA